MEGMETMEALQEATVPNEGEPSETVETESDNARPQAEEVTEEQSEADVPADESFLDVEFYKNSKSLSRDEAVKYAQMGMNYEKLEPVISKIDYLAAINGVTREQYIEQQLQNQEADMRKQIIDKYGDDESIINEMMAFQKQKHKKAYDDMIAKAKADEKTAEESTETRLAEEFAGLVSEFPELEGKTFKDLPKTVKQAGFGGEKLLNAYLQYKHKEAKNIAAAKAQAEEAAKKTAGSMSSDNIETQTAEEKGYLSGLWGR